MFVSNESEIKCVLINFSGLIESHKERERGGKR